MTGRKLMYAHAVADGLEAYEKRGNTLLPAEREMIATLRAMAVGQLVNVAHDPNPANARIVMPGGMN